MKIWQGFLGNVLGGLLVREHLHALELEQKRRIREDKVREEEWSRARAALRAEWDNARSDRQRD